MKTLALIGGIGVALACAIVGLVARTSRRHRVQVRVALEQNGQVIADALAHRQAEVRVRLATKREAQHRAEETRRQAEEQARLAAEQEAQRRDEEASRQAEEQARLAAEREAQRWAEETRRRAEEHARLAAEQEAQRRAEETRRLAEEHAGLAAMREAQRRAEEARRQGEEQARLAAKREAQRRAEEARRQAEEQARLAAEQEAQLRAEETRQQAEEQARLAAEQEPQYQVDAQARLAAEQEAQRQADEVRQQAEYARRLAEQEALHRADEQARLATELEESSDQTEAIAPVPADGTEPPFPSAKSAAPPRAPQYRPPSGVRSRAARQASAATRRDSGRPDEDTGATERAVPIELRVLFDRSRCCHVTLLPKRRSGFPEQCTVSMSNGTSLDLVALEDDWYQDVEPENLGSLLRAGTLLVNESTEQRWVLAGREIFVLAAGTTHRGFVTCPRLTLGREHGVLCTRTRLADVEHALRTAGCLKWRVFREDDGAPSGWVFIGDTDRSGRPRGIVPANAVPLVESSNVLNVLRPLPEIEILLDGGVPLGYSSWLAGCPPAIRVIGHAQHVQKVLIDGMEATIGIDGALRAPGWDEPGSHEVWCSNISRTYSLIRVDGRWEPWPAYLFAPPTGPAEHVAICGPLVRPLTGESLERETDRFDTNAILQTNPILLGPVPGQVFTAVTRGDLRGALPFACPPFAAVWALPADPLHCQKTAHHVLLVCATGNGVPPDEKATAGAVSEWCRLILDASRKRLSVEPAEAKNLWDQYRKLARSLWRKTR